MAHALDNPIWSALTTRHAGLASGGAAAKRYAPEVAPFVAVPDSGRGAAEALDALVAVGETVDLCGVAPAFDARWHLEEHSSVLQMIRTRPLETDAATPVTPLTDADVPQMLRLTALVFPGYFRPRTIAMGSYIGIWQHGELAAMAGERMAIDGFTEVSAVCTHPAHTGRGYASQLVALVTNAILARGEQAFLHVSLTNERAIGVYQRSGFIERARLPLWLVRKLS